MNFYSEYKKPAAKKKYFGFPKKELAINDKHVNSPNLDNCDALYESFLLDWEALRERHKGQKEIIDAIFTHNKKYVFVRMGRKGAKTTTNIDVAWRFGMQKPRRTTFICLPTIALAVEVYWDEKRLQWCDQDNSHMLDKYVKHIDNTRHILTFNNESSIKLIGTWSEARGRGTQPDFLCVDEVQDCSAEYLDAMEPNLAAKKDSICLMSGTPPRKKNHYHEWEERIIQNKEGFNVSYSSYVNTALPHLKSWLDNKRLELIKAGKEDIWLREYMAEDCFRSDDRVIPDIEFVDYENLVFKLRSTDATVFQPLFGLVVTEHHMTATYSLLLHSRYTGSTIYTLECNHINRIWNRSYSDIYKEFKNRMEEISKLFPKPWRQILFDTTESFIDIVPGMAMAKNDLKWSKRGIPLLKEMILNGKITFTVKASDIGVEAQNLLKDDDIKDFPLVCAMSMIINEYYVSPSMNRHEQEQWDKMAALREAGIVCTPPNPRALKPYLGRQY